MRTNNIKVTINMPLPVDKPDKNGVIYSKEALTNAFANARNKPLITYTSEGVQVPIGIINGATIYEEEQLHAEIRATVFFGGTCEEITKDSNDIVTEMTITGIGLCK